MTQMEFELSSQIVNSELLSIKTNTHAHSRTELNQKWIIPETSGLELTNPHYPTVTELKITYASSLVGDELFLPCNPSPTDQTLLASHYSIFMVAVWVNYIA